MKKLIICVLSVLLVFSLTAAAAGTGVLALNETSIPAVSRAECASATGKPRLEWNAVPNAKGYQVYRSEAIDGKYTKIGSPTKTGQTDSGAAAGVTYFYKVRAVDASGGAGSFSRPVEIKCGGSGDIYTPEIPIK